MYNGPYPGNPARGDWRTPFTAEGNIIQLAATSSKIYALCGENPGSFILKESSNGSGWANVPSAPAAIQSIYEANNQLFIGAGTIVPLSLSIYVYNSSAFIKLADTQNKLLNGAAWDGSSNYYLSVKDLITESGGCIYLSDGSTLAGTNLIGNSNNIPFMGIINLGSSIAAISRDGILYSVTSANISSTGRRLRSGSNDKLATGALAIWQQDINNPSSPKLLLAGRQDKPENSVNYLHGYQELSLASGAISGGDAFRDPGKGFPSTIGFSDDNNATYKSNMEKNPVNSFFQAGDGTLFASTQNNGVWSYRLRDGKWQWNAEQ
jgi:hypothetical protein